MDEIKLRPAVEEDSPAIRALIRASGINPTGLDWHRFLVAESAAGAFLGCGQLKPHSDGTLELASLAVIPLWRGKGVAHGLLQALMAKAPRPLYLTCRSGLGRFYEKFGFRAITTNAMPPCFRRLSQLTSLINSLRLMNKTLLVMKLD